MRRPCPICAGNDRERCDNCEGTGTVAQTPTVFRVFPDGDVIALFPTVPADLQGRCMSYQHIGQHGPANYQHVITNSRRATPAECADLAAELTRIGYVVRPVTRVTRRMDEHRRATLREWLAAADGR